VVIGHFRAGWVRLVLLCVALSGAARANPAADEAEARRQLKLGAQLYQSQKYAAAIAAFEVGYALVPRPQFLLNIGQAYRQLGKLDLAEEYLQRFVTQSRPGELGREEALALLLKIKQARPAPVTEAPPPPPPRDPVPAAPVTVTVAPVVEPARPAGRRAIGWTGLSLALVGVAGGAVGGGLLALADQETQRLNRPMPGMPFDPADLDRRDALRTGGIALLVVGGALAITGTVLSARFLRR
jgi:tetratricopeptide (TPR) repeat protein